MTTWGNICRVCSSPADYEVFAKIPTYLHATTNEFLNWQKPINVLLEETTGLKVTSDDGLPRFICALCISYLKHAVCFREQVINNALGLKAVQALRTSSTDENKQQQQQQQQQSDKESLLITAKDLNYNEERKTDANLLFSSENRDKVRKQLLNNVDQATTTTTQICEGITNREHIRYLNRLFDKESNVVSKHDKSEKTIGDTFEAATGSDPFGEDFQTASSDDNEANEHKLNYFTYREKNFEEDDIMDLDELKDVITVNIPESCKERKCRACFRRFMFEESFKEHLETCIEYKFLITIEEINRLLDIRRGKAISPHEFIRRMIFCLRKTCEWLKANCGEMLLPDLLQNGEGGLGGKKRSESEGKSSTADASSAAGDGGCGIGTGTDLKFEENRPQNLTISDRLAKTGEIKSKTKMTDFTFNTTITKTDLLNDLAIFCTPRQISRTTTPISVENNILYEIERSQNRNKQSEIETKKQRISPVQEQDRITFLQKLQNAASTTAVAAPVPISDPNETILKVEAVANASPLISVRKDLAPTIVNANSNKSNPGFSARCNLCNMAFATVAELEEHNAVYHNAQQLEEEKLKSELDERERIIALFEESSDD